MKTYVTDHSLRYVGKAWQIRAALRKFADSKITLQSYLQFQCQQQLSKVNLTESKHHKQ